MTKSTLTTFTVQQVDFKTYFIQIAGALKTKTGVILIDFSPFTTPAIDGYSPGSLTSFTNAAFSLSLTSKLL